VRKGATQGRLQLSTFFDIPGRMCMPTCNDDSDALLLLPVGMPQAAFSQRDQTSCVRLNVPNWSHVEEGLFVRVSTVLSKSVCTSELFIISFGKVTYNIFTSKIR